MRITVDVELRENELGNVSHIQQALQGVSSSLVTKFVTDKSALSARLLDAVSLKQLDRIESELTERLCQVNLWEDCLDALCSSVLFSSPRCEKGDSVEPFILLLSRLPEPHRDRVKSEIVRRALTFLSSSRRLDCSRAPLLPYAEVLACMVKYDLLPVRSVVYSYIQLIRMDCTRSAGLTCLGKLVEIAHDIVCERCDPSTMDSLRTSVALTQQNDVFLYDVEYITESFGWNTTPKYIHFGIRRSGLHHSTPILSISYSGGVGAREAIITSSMDGAIGTWDFAGSLTENIILSRHYASTVELANRGHTLIVGTVGRHMNTPPAIVLYSEEINNSAKDLHWEESGATEPKGARFITAVRSFPTSGLLNYCVAASGGSSGQLNPLLLYDTTHLVHEYHEHVDMITSLHIPSDREHLVWTGSRDCSAVLYDTRARKSVSAITQHFSTVTSIGTCQDFILSAGLDKRLVLQDYRMLGQLVSTKETDSPVIAMAFNNTMIAAASTMTGIYLMNFANGSVPITCRAESGKRTPRYHAVCWNHQGNVLYAGGDSQTLDLYARAFGDNDGFDN